MKTVVEVAQEVRAGRLKVTAIVDECIAEIESKNDRVNAFVHLDAQGARRQAEEMDLRIRRGEDPGPLAGVPFGVKDIAESCAGMPRRNGSLFHKDDPAESHDSVFIARLRAAGRNPGGQSRYRRIRHGWRHSYSGPRHHAQSVESEPHSRRQQWRIGSGSVRRVGAFLHRERCGWIDTQSGRLHGDGGIEAQSGPHSADGRLWRPELPGRDHYHRGGHSSDSGRRCRARPLRPDDSYPRPRVRYEEAIETLNVAGLRVVWSEDLGFAPVEPEIAALTRAAAFRLADAAGLQVLDRKVRFTNIYMAANMHLTRRFAAVLRHRGILPAQRHLLSPGPRWFLDKAEGFDDEQVFEAMQERESAGAGARRVFP